MNASCYFSFPFVVIWQPPYTNSEKRQPCYTMNEAQCMVEWFKSINVPAKIIRPVIFEDVLDTHDS